MKVCSIPDGSPSFVESGNRVGLDTRGKSNCLHGREEGVCWCVCCVLGEIYVGVTDNYNFTVLTFSLCKIA